MRGWGAPVSVNDDIKRFKTYMRFKPDIRMEYVYYYDEPYNNPITELMSGFRPRRWPRKFAEGFRIPFRKVLTPNRSGLKWISCPRKRDRQVVGKRRRQADFSCGYSTI